MKDGFAKFVGEVTAPGKQNAVSATCVFGKRKKTKNIKTPSLTHRKPTLPIGSEFISGGQLQNKTKNFVKLRRFGEFMKY
jgi:hypothetical protein